MHPKVYKKRDNKKWSWTHFSILDDTLLAWYQDECPVTFKRQRFIIQDHVCKENWHLSTTSAQMFQPTSFDGIIPKFTPGPEPLSFNIFGNEHHWDNMPERSSSRSTNPLQRHLWTSLAAVNGRVLLSPQLNSGQQMQRCKLVSRNL